MGFAYFASPRKKQAKEITWHEEKKKRSGYKTHSEVRVHVKKDMFLHNSLVIENVRISR